MTSKERLWRALHHQPVDMVPVEVRWKPKPFNSNDPLNRVPKFTPLINCMIKEADNIHFWDPKVGYSYADGATTEIKKSGEVRGEFYYSAGVTIRIKVLKEVKGEYKITSYEIPTPKGKLTAIYKFIEATWGNMPIKSFIEEKKDVDKFLSLPYLPLNPEVKSYFEIEKKLGDRGIMQVSLSDPFYVLAGICNFEQIYIWIKTDLKMIQELLSEFCRRICDLVETLFKKGVGPLFWFCGPEQALPPWVNPSYFDSLITDYDSKIFELVHKHKGLVRVHSHGNAMDFLENFRDMGVDALEPLEPPPLGNVILKQAKRLIGDKVCLCGNLPNLDRLSLKEVDTLVHQAIEDGAPGYGFILTTAGAAYQPNDTSILINNLIQMVKSARKYGEYK